MESPQTPNIDRKEKKGLGKFWKRFKAAFKDKERSSQPSSRPVSQPPPAKPTVAEVPPTEYVTIYCTLRMTDMNRQSLPTVVATSTQPKETPPSDQPPEASKAETKEVEEPKPVVESSTDMAPSKTDVEKRLERIHAVFKKYDFAFEDESREVPIALTESRPKAPYERIQKNIRMRVKYTCHNCRTVYGHDRICISCQHKRCPDCTRYPPKKKTKKPKEDREVAVVDTTQQSNQAEQRCTCHECQTGFEPGAEECPNCHHQICSICLKEAMVTIATEAPPAATTSESKPEQPQQLKPPEPPTASSTAT